MVQITNSGTLRQNVKSLGRGDRVEGSTTDILGTTNTEIISDENNMLPSHVKPMPQEHICLGFVFVSVNNGFSLTYKYCLIFQDFTIREVYNKATQDQTQKNLRG